MKLMTPTNNRRLESIIYAGLWLLVIILFMLDTIRDASFTNGAAYDVRHVGRCMLILMPFIVLFALNNFLLIPRYLKHGRYGVYFIAVIVAIIAVWGWQRFQFHFVCVDDWRPPHPRPMHHGHQPLMPLPLFLDMVYDVLIVGVNLAVSLMFQHFDDRIEQERLMKENAENQLTYLKAQINPHFYMNMLNNIHGMIEINPVKAQDMVIEMSGLMRYMLYESSRPEIDLSSEVDFIRDYLELMKVRYPDDKVSISVRLPEPKDVAGVSIPPLLFLVFIENAFKHGISYSDDSYVSVCLMVDDNRVMFSCMNSVHGLGEIIKTEGIGLENVKKRMDIIYGERYSLMIESTDKRYSVNLTLPYEA